MLAITRHHVPDGEAADFQSRAHHALDALSAQTGWRGGWVGRAADDPSRWVVVTEWADVGSYRRAIAAYPVTVAMVPLLASAIDEPTAFEVLTRLRPEEEPTEPPLTSAVIMHRWRADAPVGGEGRSARTSSRTTASSGSATTGRTGRAADADVVGVGEAAAPVVPTDLD